MERAVPEVKVLIDGKEIDKSMYSKLLLTNIDLDLSSTDMVKLKFNNSDYDLQDESSFVVGKSIEVSFGYSQKYTKMLEAEIVKIDFEFNASSYSSVTVVGLDKMFRLNKTPKTRTFLKVKDSDIASQIASEMGLKADVDSTSQTHEYLFQHDQSNLDFLKYRASHIGYEVKVEESSLLFKKSRIQDKKESVELKWEENLVELVAKQDITKVVTEVEVKGWNQAEKKEVKGVAKGGDEISSISGSSGIDKMKKFEKTEAKIFKSMPEISSQEEAESIAKAILNSYAIEYSKIQGVAMGEPKIKLGKLITIKGIGSKISGEYYITACTHIFNARGYRTLFEAKRNVDKE